MIVKGNEQKPKGSYALTIAGCLTGAYLLLVAILLWWQGQTIATFRDMALNELGDFLAGVFAPIAFLWLVAAVLIQRRELELTRIEFEMNRNVTEKQATEAQKQAEFIGRQTELLTAENDERAQKRMDDLYDTRFNSLNHSIAELQKAYYHWYEASLGTSQSAPFVSKGPVSIDAFKRGLSAVEVALTEGGMQSAPGGDVLERTRGILEAIVRMRTSLSSMALERASNFDFQGMLELTVRVQNRLNEWVDGLGAGPPSNP